MNLEELKKVTVNTLHNLELVGVKEYLCPETKVTRNTIGVSEKETSFYVLVNVDNPSSFHAFDKSRTKEEIKNQILEDHELKNIVIGLE